MVLKNALTAFSGEQELRCCDIRVEDGVIRSIGNNLNDDINIDCTGLWLFPGAVDPHVHFYDPGYTQKEDFFSGTAFAASGGVTCVIDMPCTSEPPVTHADHLNRKLGIVQPKAHIDFAFFGGVSRQLFDETPGKTAYAGYKAAMASIADKVMGFKAYAVSGMDDIWGALDYYRLEKLLEYARELSVPVLLHTEDRSYVDNASADFRSRGKSPREWYSSRPEIAEVLAAGSASQLAKNTGGDLHIVHIGSAGVCAHLSSGASEANGSRPDYRVTGETCPQYLAFGLEDFEKQGAVLKIAPPIKRKENHEGLWTALADGTLSFVASDHAPGTEREKAPGDIWKNSAGIAGTGTLFPYMLSEGFMKGRLALPRFLKAVSENAPKRYGFFDRKGSIAPGKDADFVIIDPESSWTVDQKSLLTKGTVSPFHGMTFNGRILSTWVRGRKIYDAESGICTKPGWGRFITPDRT